MIVKQQLAESIEVKKYVFGDDGNIPNSKLPLLVYKTVLTAEEEDLAHHFEELFASNNWINSWRNGVYPFHHYHSTTHEVLGIYSGTAILHMGGEQGKKMEVCAGDVLVIPAGVGHKKISASNLGVVGAYPNGRSWDLNRGLPGERPATDKNISEVPLPKTDPVFGSEHGLMENWHPISR